MSIITDDRIKDRNKQVIKEELKRIQKKYEWNKNDFTRSIIKEELKSYMFALMSLSDNISNFYVNFNIWLDKEYIQIHIKWVDGEQMIMNYYMWNNKPDSKKSDLPEDLFQIV